MKKKSQDFEWGVVTFDPTQGIVDSIWLLIVYGIARLFGFGREILPFLFLAMVRWNVNNNNN